MYLGFSRWRGKPIFPIVITAMERELKNDSFFTAIFPAVVFARIHRPIYKAAIPISAQAQKAPSPFSSYTLKLTKTLLAS